MADFSFSDILNRRYPEVAALFPADEIIAEYTASAGTLPAPDVFSHLAAQRIAALGLTPEQAAACHKMAASLVQKDPMTGFDKSQYKELNLALLQQAQHERAVTPPAYLLGADVSNLRGLNLALSGSDINDTSEQAITPEGRQRTDAVLRLFSQVIKDEVESMVERHQASGDHSAHASFYRDGGDELSAIVSGLSPQEMQAVQTGVHTRISGMMERAGLDDILHPKYPFLGERTGAGLACAFEEITPDATLAELGNTVDSKVESIKEMRGEMRVSVPEARTRLSESDIERAIQVLQEEARHAGLDMQTHSEMSAFPFHDKPPLQNDAGKAEDFIWPALRRKMQVDGEINRLGLTGSGAALLGKLHQIYEAHDPVTGYQRHSPMGVISDGLAFLENQPDENMHVLVFEMQNFAGLNEKLGHDGCNKLFGDLAHKIQMPSDQTLYYRPDGRGDRLYIFTRGSDGEEVAKTVEKIAALTDVFVSVNGLGDLPNPRYPEDEYKGVRFIVGATQLSAGNTPEDVFQQLDQQIVGNKQAQQCFDGQAIGAEQVKIDFSGRNKNNTMAQSASFAQAMNQPDKGGASRGR